VKSAALPRARVTPTGGGPEAQLCVREPPETVVSPNMPGGNVLAWRWAGWHTFIRSSG